MNFVSQSRPDFKLSNCVSDNDQTTPCHITENSSAQILIITLFLLIFHLSLYS